MPQLINTFEPTLKALSDLGASYKQSQIDNIQKQGMLQDLEIKKMQGQQAQMTLEKLRLDQEQAKELKSLLAGVDDISEKNKMTYNFYQSKNPEKAMEFAGKIFTHAKSIADIDPKAAGEFINNNLGTSLKVTGKPGDQIKVEDLEKGLIHFLDPYTKEVVKTIEVSPKTETESVFKGKFLKEKTDELIKSGVSQSDARQRALKALSEAERKPPGTDGSRPTDISQYVENLNQESIRITGKPMSPGERAKASMEFKRSQPDEKGLSKLSEEMSKDLVKSMEAAQGAVKGLEDISEAKKLFDKGIITGTGAEFITSFGNALSSRLGFKQFDDPVSNTQAYVATVGNQVGQVIKQFGSGTGLSDADREYAQQIVAGKVTLNKDSIKKLIDINDRAFRNVIKHHNKKAEAVKSKPGADGLPYDISVEIPEEKNSSMKIITELPQGAKQIGTSNGKAVYQLLDDRKIMEQ